jgi:hypothetical protein
VNTSHCCQPYFILEETLGDTDVQKWIKKDVIKGPHLVEAIAGLEPGIERPIQVSTVSMTPPYMHYTAQGKPDGLTRSFLIGGDPVGSAP